MLKCNFYRGWNQLSKGSIEKVVGRDLDYIIKVTQFLEIIMDNIWTTVRISEKCSSMTFIEVDIRVQNGVSPFSISDLDINFQRQKFKILIYHKR